uniref:Putative secreted protein n=1 Tax=Anopheles triannulatus TaxID=58253 RepID=A0A2M4B289_9DIPT
MTLLRLLVSVAFAVESPGGLLTAFCSSSSSSSSRLIELLTSLLLIVLLTADDPPPPPPVAVIDDPTVVLPPPIVASSLTSRFVTDVPSSRDDTIELMAIEEADGGLMVVVDIALLALTELRDVGLPSALVLVVCSFRLRYSVSESLRFGVAAAAAAAADVPGTPGADSVLLPADNSAGLRRGSELAVLVNIFG